MENVRGKLVFANVKVDITEKLVKTIMRFAIIFQIIVMKI